LNASASSFSSENRKQDNIHVNQSHWTVILSLCYNKQRMDLRNKNNRGAKTIESANNYVYIIFESEERKERKIEDIFEKSLRFNLFNTIYLILFI